MFIEKISDEAKQAYIRKIVDQNNASVKNGEGLLCPVELPWGTAEMKKLGHDHRIAYLGERNIFFGIYETHAPRLAEQDTARYAFVTKFADTQAKTSIYSLNPAVSLYENITDIWQMLNRYELNSDSTNSLEVDNAYVKEFVLPNLRAIDEKRETHFAEDYKVALANKLARKQHLATQKQQDDLFVDDLCSGISKRKATKPKFSALKIKTKTTEYSKNAGREM